MSLENFEYVQLIGKPKAKCKVWTHFGFPTDATGMVIDKKKKNICWLLKVNVAYWGNTLDLAYHLWQVQYICVIQHDT